MIKMKRGNQILLLVVSTSAAATLATAVSTNVAESINTDLETRMDAIIDRDDDDDYFFIPHEGNSTVSATFSIRVTPEHYHMLSWTILWLCFASAVVFGIHQIKLERRWIRHTILTSVMSSSNNASSRYNLSKRKHPSSSPSDPELGGGGRKNYTRSGGRLVRSSSRVGGSRDRMTASASSASIQSNAGIQVDEQQPSVSSGDMARATFRRLILFAMISRTIAIPIQIYSDPLWIQLIADTFPVMAFATAWMWLVSFFIQLVGVAMGTNINTQLGSGGIASIGANSGPGGGPTATSNPSATIDTVIQITAYSVYGLLMIAFSVFGRIASAVLLYALLCCVYATLLGMGMFFCPRLLGLVLPALRGKWKSPLALRLVACSTVCLVVFTAQTFSFARKVVQSTVPMSHKGNGPYWWFQYGALELLPGILFLVLLHPKLIPRAPSPDANNDSSSKSTTDSAYSGRKTPPGPSYHKRTDSSDSKSASARLTHSPQPSRSPTPIRQQQQPPTSTGASKESTPLLSTHSNFRYGGGIGAATMGTTITDVNVSIEQQSSSD